MGLYLLREVVIKYSENEIWEEAVKEWDITDCIEEENQAGWCICGKEQIRYQFTVKNRYNGISLYPIGSHCIKKFGRKDMSEKTELLEDVFKLNHAVKDNAFLLLSPKQFSRKMLEWLHEGGAFDTAYNNYHGENDYEFFLKMFNKRNKADITIKQDKKIKAIILNSIRPFFNELITNDGSGFMDRYATNQQHFKERRRAEFIEKWY